MPIDRTLALKPMAAVRWRPVKRSPINVTLIEPTGEAPIPCTTRSAISIGRLVAKTHAAPATAKRINPGIMIRRRP